jgi:hypothetical protein
MNQGLAEWHRILIDWMGYIQVNLLPRFEIVLSYLRELVAAPWAMI